MLEKVLPQKCRLENTFFKSRIKSNIRKQINAEIDKICR